MTAPEGMRITVTKDGPFQVEGGVPLARRSIEPNEHGESWDWGEGEHFETTQSYRLCRCGGSKNKPFCDDSHLTNGFDGTETAEHTPYLEQAQVYAGPIHTLTDAESFCSYARFCDARGAIWRLIHEDDPEAAELSLRQGEHCPSGRLVVWRDRSGDQPTDPSEPDLEPSIGVVEDVQLGVSSGLWVRGGVPVYSADGTPYEVRNRVMLCRCGASENKPFCDGSHASIGFKDENAAREEAERR
jgi:CDGSH-type Zn-finger protein